MSWEVTGNSGLDPATKFLGTTDGRPLLIKTNGVERMHVGAGGGVGIGTTPERPLHVAGGAMLESASNTAYPTLDMKDSSPGQACQAGITFLNGRNEVAGYIRYDMKS